MKGTRTWYDGTPPLRDRAIVTWHLHPTLGKDVWLNPYPLIYLIRQLRVCSLDILFTIIDFGLIRHHYMSNCIRRDTEVCLGLIPFQWELDTHPIFLLFSFFFFAGILVHPHLKLGLEIKSLMEYIEWWVREKRT